MLARSSTRSPRGRFPQRSALRALARQTLISTPLHQLRRTLFVPIAVSAAALVLLIAFTDAPKSWTSLAMFTLIAFVLAVVGQEFWRGVGARRVMAQEPPPTALARLVARNRRRWGGYIVHCGIAILFLGVAASSAFHSQRDVRLSPGQTTRVAELTRMAISASPPRRSSRRHRTWSRRG